MATKRTVKRNLAFLSGGASVLAVLSLAVTSKGCGDMSSGNEVSSSSLGQPSINQVALDGQSVFDAAAFTTQLPIPKTFAPTVIRNGSGQIIRNEYTITDSQTQVQMLPAGFPTTTVLAMGGAAVGGGNTQTSPAAIFNNTRGIPTVVHWRTNIGQPYFLAVDPTIHWADPQAIEKPTPPFNLFPPGYANAQYPGRARHPHPRADGAAADGRHGGGVVHERAVPRSELRDRGLHHAQRSAGDAALLSRPRDGR